LPLDLSPIRMSDRDLLGLVLMTIAVLMFTTGFVLAL
jgi:hypothetical protein